MITIGGQVRQKDGEVVVDDLWLLLLLDQLFRFYSFLYCQPLMLEYVYSTV
jgi:hypothetical protein